jgi:hypothetical protein
VNYETNNPYLGIHGSKGNAAAKQEANILLTIMSSSFVISRGGTKAHFEGKIPEV